MVQTYPNPMSALTLLALRATRLSVVGLCHSVQSTWRQLARDPEVYDADPVRFEVMRHFGAFVTESSGHFSEYVPYVRKRPDLLKRYILAGYRGESGF